MCGEDVGVVYICVMPVGGMYVFGGFPLVCLCDTCSVCGCCFCVYLCVVYLWRLPSGVGVDVCVCGGFLGRELKCIWT